VYTLDAGTLLQRRGLAAIGFGVVAKGIHYRVHSVEAVRIATMGA